MRLAQPRRALSATECPVTSPADLLPPSPRPIRAPPHELARPGSRPHRGCGRGASACGHATRWHDDGTVRLSEPRRTALAVACYEAPRDRRRVAGCLVSRRKCCSGWHSVQRRKESAYSRCKAFHPALPANRLANEGLTALGTALACSCPSQRPSGLPRVTPSDCDFPPVLARMWHAVCAAADCPTF
jgi:hypothetical protein